PDDIRLRFFSMWHSLPQRQLARLTQIDYDREMAFVLFDPKERILGIGRLAADPNNQRAEFAVIVRSDLKGKGIGEMLMHHILDYAKNRGTEEVFGDILWENRAMIALSRKLGFTIEAVPGAPDIVRAVIPVKTPA
ncbi:MAG TPA: GNAT family N-acetyltransferase, partial [Rhizomicrobium sp.]|nr:GNAT family N-acetyltransferase [Rhizomicrobium sp.]